MPSQAKLFAAPASYLEIASDQVAFQSWLELQVDEVEDADDAALTLEEMAERLERIAATEQAMDRKRAQWIARSKDKEEQITAHLNVRMLAQRAARENSPIIFNALQAAGESSKPAQQRAARCFRCGTDVRYIATGKCVECQRRANAGKWHKASEREYRDRNRDTINDRAREDRRKRNDEINKRRRERRQERKSDPAYRASINEYNRQRLSDPAKREQRNQRKRASYQTKMGFT